MRVNAVDEWGLVEGVEGTIKRVDRDHGVIRHYIAPGKFTIYKQEKNEFLRGNQKSLILLILNVTS